MDAVSTFLNQMDWFGLVIFLMSIVACLICITFHELAHGLAAFFLGDPTAKVNGRLTLNPISHIDVVGLLMMMFVRVGWAKPVPIDTRNFASPKRDMALSALAGPVSNMLLALAAVGVGSVLYHLFPGGIAVSYLLLFLCYLTVFSVGLGLFNLIPLPPLDGSKILYALLPDGVYWTILRYERFMMLFVVALAWLGFFGGPLSAAISWVVRGMCTVTQFPAEIFAAYGFF